MGKLIDRNGRLFGKVSVIDIVVVLVVLVMAMALHIRSNKLNVGNDEGYDTPITFTVLAENVALNVADALEVGDLVYDKDNTSIGTIGQVIAVEKLPGKRVVQLVNGTYAVTVNEHACNLRVTVRGEGNVTDGHYMINGVYKIGMNASRNFYTPYTIFTGNVTEIG